VQLFVFMVVSLYFVTLVFVAKDFSAFVLTHVDVSFVNGVIIYLHTKEII